MRSLSLLVILCACSRPALVAERTAPRLDALIYETEPNDTIADALPLSGPNVFVRGDLFEENDTSDLYLINAGAYERISASVTALANVDADLVLEVLASDGVTVREIDQVDGAFTSRSATIANHAFASAGTYYLRVSRANAQPIAQYDLSFARRTFFPFPESEPNDITPEPLTSAGYMEGSIASSSDIDLFTAQLMALGTLLSTATVTPPTGILDGTLSDNSATDTSTITVPEGMLDTNPADNSASDSDVASTVPTEPTVPPEPSNEPEPSDNAPPFARGCGGCSNTTGPDLMTLVFAAYCLRRRGQQVR